MIILFGDICTKQKIIVYFKILKMANDQELINLLREKVQNRENARILAEEYNALLQKELNLMTSTDSKKVQNGLQLNSETANGPSIVSLKRTSSQRSNSSKSSLNSSTSSSSSSSSSSSDSSSSEDSSAAEEEENFASKSVLIPSDLRSGKRRAVTQMISEKQSPMHKHFAADEEEQAKLEGVLSNSSAINTPNVIRTEVRLYNPKSVYSANQLKRMRAEKRNQTELQEALDYGNNDKRTYQESYPYNDSNTIDQNVDEEKDHNEETMVSGHQTPEDDIASPNYDGLEKCTAPKKGMMIAFKVSFNLIQRMELSAAYTPEISDYNEACVLSVKKIASELILELRLIQKESIPKDPEDGWSSIKKAPKPHYYDDYEIEEKRGRFEMDLDDDLQTEQDHDPNRPLLIEWSALIDARIIA